MGEREREREREKVGEREKIHCSVRTLLAIKVKKDGEKNARGDLEIRYVSH